MNTPHPNIGDRLSQFTVHLDYGDQWIVRHCEYFYIAEPIYGGMGVLITSCPFESSTDAARESHRRAVSKAKHCERWGNE